MKQPFFTIGHSTRSPGEFVDLLQDLEIGFLADIRKIPRSKTNPQFNTDTLASALAAADIISYEHMAALAVFAVNLKACHKLS